MLQAARAQLLMWLTGQHDVAFGTAVSGRPAEVAGADSMVGLLINTVPTRARITAATTIADLLDQLQNAYNHTLEHQHLALPETLRLTGHDQLLDTLFVYENYPIGTAALAGPMGLRVECDTEVSDAAGVEMLMERLRRVLVAISADSGQQS